MTQEPAPIPAMTLEELFSSARAAGHCAEVASMTLHFQLRGDGLRGAEDGHGTLTICRNPYSTRWMTTVGIAQGERIHARIAQGKTADEALNKIERYCYWWLGV
jgi:hypothetical protein